MKLKSSEPFWLVKNGILHTYPSLREDITTDILIIGGGITGSLIAHQCMADGHKLGGYIWRNQGWPTLYWSTS